MGNSLKFVAGFLFIFQVGGFAQAVKWQDAGSYDYAGHNGKTPAYPGTDGPMNPAYTATRVYPEIDATVGGLAWLPNGDLVLLEFGAVTRKSGALTILKNVSSASQSVTSETILKGLDDPLGVQVVDGVIYVNDQGGVWRVEKSESGTYSKTLFSPRPVAARKGNYPFAFNLEYHGGFLYYAMGNHNISSPESAPWPGHVYKVDIKTGTVETMNDGIRMPNGMGVKKATGDLFYSDNQGQWRKASPVFHVQKGAFNGHPALKTGGSWFPGTAKVTPPAVWLPSNSRSTYGAMTRSTTGLHEVENGIYKGQFLMGDNYMGRVNRIFLEKVNEVYQGATFHFSNTVKGGIQTMIESADGTLIGGALGDPQSGWNWQGVLGGLTKWTPNKNGVMDILEIRSNRKGFDLEFTEPVKAADISPESFWVVSYAYNNWSEDYGGSPEDVKKMKITAIESSVDRKQVAITIEGLAKGRVYNIMFKSGLQSESGKSNLFQHAWYTLNEISDRDVLQTVAIAKVDRVREGFQFDLQGRSLDISNLQSQNFSVKVYNPAGRIVPQSVAMGRQGKASIRFSDRGVYILRILTPQGSFSKELTIL
ncbi:MAG: T9SS type A sorting domain-containing protein [Fibrobacteria bacterium]